MIKYEIILPKTTKILTAYHRHDILSEDDIIDPISVSYKHIGKYIAFTDGSELYAKIIGVSRKLLVTSWCMIRRRELVHIAIPRDYGTYYGVTELRYVHPAVRRYNIQEFRNVGAFINGKMGAKLLSDRERILVKEKLAKSLEEQGATPEWMAERLKEEADRPNGRNFAFALSAIAKQSDLDLTTPPEKALENQNRTNALIGIIGRQLESKQISMIPNDNTILGLRDLNKLIALTGPAKEPEELIDAEYEVLQDIREKNGLQRLGLKHKQKEEELTDD